MARTFRGNRSLILVLALLHYHSQSPALLFQGIQSFLPWGSGSHRQRVLRGSTCRRAKVSEVPEVDIRFSHVHLYTDSLRSLEEYKALESKLNTFAERQASSDSKVERRETWLALTQELGEVASESRDPAQWQPAGQDVVEQLLASLGWRITGYSQCVHTHSVVLTSADPAGVKFVVTAHVDKDIEQLASVEPETLSTSKPGATSWDHFSASHLARFSKHRGGRTGIAVLGFAVEPGTVEKIRARYAALHPELLLPDSPRVYSGATVLEVFAYYQGDKLVSDADRGTVLRFVEVEGTGSKDWILPGVETVEASFDSTSLAAYCDHWVSNVVSRTGFLDTLHDTLGFTPKVDFNAGVVAAGEAQIESTVSGNSPIFRTSDKGIALKDQSQVYLPTNNALSEVGHVHLYLQEIGQGVQHIASRVADLPAVVQRANDFREATGSGISFLTIPQSYYGTLTAKQLSQDADVEEAFAESCLAGLRLAGLLDAGGVVALSATREAVASVLPKSVPELVVEAVLRARYRNLYAFAGNALSEETYLKIARNNILMDVQGEDLLLQIFSSNVLQRESGQEAPFLEFIQRVCSERSDPATGRVQGMRPGCGGFGIRNFLTLFLSIEVCKAAKSQEAAEAAGDAEAASLYARMVKLFNEQLDESNPVLTDISDAMTAEGEALEREDAAAIEQFKAKKAEGQATLQQISQKYNDLMAELRKGSLTPAR